MKSKAILITVVVLILIALFVKVFLIYSENKQIDSELAPVMAEFANKAKTFSYTVVADGTLNYGTALNSTLAKRDAILRKYNCTPGKWWAEEISKGRVRVKFMSYQCPLNLFGGKT